MHKKIIKMFMSMKDKNKASKQGGQKGEVTADSLDEMENVDGRREEEEENDRIER